MAGDSQREIQKKCSFSAWFLKTTTTNWLSNPTCGHLLHVIPSRSPFPTCPFSVIKAEKRPKNAF